MSMLLAPGYSMAIDLGTEILELDPAVVARIEALTGDIDKDGQALIERLMQLGLEAIEDKGEEGRASGCYPAEDEEPEKDPKK